MVKYLILFWVLTTVTCCAEQNVLRITVKNGLSIARIDETVQLPWDALKKKIKGLEKNNIIVLNSQGVEIPSQVVYHGNEFPVGVIFQVTVAPDAQTVYTVKTGTPGLYQPIAFGRIVPERKDDFAWENNLVGHRMYGPALEATGEISNGIDIWVKRTDKLVIDDWYKKDNYHVDHGEGMDCYKVGRMLGAGAMAPYVNDSLWLGKNFVEYKVLDNGPLRVCFSLKYAPFQAGESNVSEIRTITLDGNTRFNKIENLYEGAPDGMPVAAGIISREAQGETGGEMIQDITAGYLGYWEPTHGKAGNTAVAILFPDGAKEMVTRMGHLIAVAEYKAGEPFVYYMGTAWSKGGIETSQVWFELLKKEREIRKHPLKVTF